MAEENRENKSVIEKIYDEMFSIIEEKGKFNSKSIQKLKNLAYYDHFKQEKSIKEVIESEKDDKNENNRT